MNRHYELERRDEKTGLWRIRALRDLPYATVLKGDLGGMIEDFDNLQGEAWVHRGGLVRGNAVATDSAQISGSVSMMAEVSGHAWISQGARVGGKAKISGNTRIAEKVWISGNAVVTDKAKIVAEGLGLSLRGGIYSGNMYLRSAGILQAGILTESAKILGPLSFSPKFAGDTEGAPEISREEHYLYLGKLGSERVNVSLYRAKGGVPWITVGCWNGPLSELMTEVSRRRDGDVWADLTQLESEVLFEHYRGVRKICEAQVRLW